MDFRFPTKFSSVVIVREKLKLVYKYPRIESKPCFRAWCLVHGIETVWIAGKWKTGILQNHAKAILLRNACKCMNIYSNILNNVENNSARNVEA